MTVFGAAIGLWSEPSRNAVSRSGWRRAATHVKHLGRVRGFPGLQSFEAPGVRNVRHKLLEHPEAADSRIFSQTVVLGGPGGDIVLKSNGPDAEDHQFSDAGLTANSTEFRVNLEAALRTALDREV